MVSATQPLILMAPVMLRAFPFGVGALGARGDRRAVHVCVFINTNALFLWVHRVDAAPPDGGRPELSICSCTRVERGGSGAPDAGVQDQIEKDLRRTEAAGGHEWRQKLEALRRVLQAFATRELPSHHRLRAGDELHCCGAARGCCLRLRPSGCWCTVIHDVARAAAVCRVLATR